MAYPAPTSVEPLKPSDFLRMGGALFHFTGVLLRVQLDDNPFTLVPCRCNRCRNRRDVLRGWALPHH